ncbi:Glycine zipper 2TM domain protein [Marinibacterium anthonyi]|nr:Glycine zipper 2TM domain protein [Marinibacterium anthonyi]
MKFIALTLPLMTLVALQACAPANTYEGQAQRRDATCAAGTVAGGVVGGVLGHQLGSGKGNSVMTAAGAGAGAMGGNALACQ